MAFRPLIARLVAAVLAVGAAACVAVAFVGDTEPTAATGSSTLVTPGWSPRRVPGPIADGVAQLRLRTEVAAELEGLSACVVVDGPAGRLVALGADTPLIPASTIKVLTAIGALSALPAEFHFTTVVRANGEIAEGAVGSVTLVGDGDPVLGTPEWIAARNLDPHTAGTTTTPLASLADQLAGQGIRAIPGGVVGVAPRWTDEPSYLPSWPARYRGAAIGPVSSLTVNAGFRGPGRAADYPALFAAEELTRLLRDRGVAVGPPSTDNGSGGMETGDVVATVDGAPLRDVVGEMLAASDNLTAEVLLREIAVADGGSSTPDGVAVVREQLEALGLPLDGFVQVDGSGLSRDNRVPCTLLQSALGATDLPLLAPVREGLAVAGERGTLADRFLGTPLVGKLSAKTGTLNGVSGLAGFVAVGPPLRFSVLVNDGFGEGIALDLRERVALTLGEYPDLVAVDALVPRPATSTR